MPVTMAVRCAGNCKALFLVEDLDPAALGIGEPLRQVTCPRHRCAHSTELDAAAWLGLARAANRKEQQELPMGMLDLRGAPPRTGRV